MFTWLTNKFQKSKPVSAQQKQVGVCPLTHKERLIAILISYHTGKITLDQTVNLIQLWRLSRKDNV